MLPPAVAKTLQGWKRTYGLPGESVSTDLIRRAQARQEYRMAWWRLLLAVVPSIEAFLDPAKTEGLFEYAIIIYALAVLIYCRLPEDQIEGHMPRVVLLGPGNKVIGTQEHPIHAP